MQTSDTWMLNSTTPGYKKLQAKHNHTVDYIHLGSTLALTVDHP